MTTNETIVHPNYDIRQNGNDLALLRLPERVDQSEIFIPILAEEEFLIGTKFQALGWGQSETGELSPILQVGSGFQLVSIYVCKERGLLLGPDMLCVRSNTSNTCTGEYYTYAILSVVKYEFVFGLQEIWNASIRVFTAPW